MAREWCVAVEAESADTTRDVAGLLSMYHFDAEREGARVLSFAESRERAETLARRAAIVLREADDADELGDPILCWNEELQRYVDPDAPGGWPTELEPEAVIDDVQWRVRVELERFRDRWTVRRRLEPLDRPVIGSGWRHIDLLAGDAVDAGSVAMRARAFANVNAAETMPITGRLERWWVRQELFGNYDAGSGG